MYVCMYVCNIYINVSISRVGRYSVRCLGCCHAWHYINLQPSPGDAKVPMLEAVRDEVFMLLEPFGYCSKSLANCRTLRCTVRGITSTASAANKTPVADATHLPEPLVLSSRLSKFQ